MDIDYTITLNYGEEGPSADEPSPTEDDIVDWITAGMAKAGFTSVNIACKRQ